MLRSSLKLARSRGYCLIKQVHLLNNPHANAWPPCAPGGASPAIKSERAITSACATGGKGSSTTTKMRRSCDACFASKRKCDGDSVTPCRCGANNISRRILAVVVSRSRLSKYCYTTVYHLTFQFRLYFYVYEYSHDALPASPGTDLINRRQKHMTDVKSILIDVERTHVVF